MLPWRRRLLAGGGSAAAPVDTRIFIDSFTGADGTLLSAHTPDKSPGGAWAVQRGVWKLSGDKAVADPGPEPYSIAVYPLSIANGTVSVSAAAPGASYGGGIMFNSVDGANGWVFVASQIGGLWALYELSSGTYTQRASSVVSIPVTGATYTLSVVVNGDSVECFVDGVSKLTYTVSNRPNKSATKWGLWSYWGSGGVMAFDNFQVSP